MVFYEAYEFQIYLKFINYFSYGFCLCCYIIKTLYPSENRELAFIFLIISRHSIFTFFQDVNGLFPD